MKANKLIALGLSGVLAAVGVTVANFEGEELAGYLDPVGIETACYGHTKTAVAGKEYTEDECLNLLAQDLAEHNSLLMSAVNVELSQGEHVAYLSFHYNVGSGNFRRSSLLRYLNEDQRLRACDELPRWVYAKGRKLVGLVVRREQERKMCIEGVNSAKNDNDTIQQH
ncbi:lysozyme [Pseudoalteromonas sp.]|uniref:lysozyme n=1 Tax=Pseudoalteromonas sp. TaxID=53249 RepID=UPI0026253CC5|nr:lysozyme [Pseudoalteromonas sp.]MCP4588380.1 lysozyme [Pseudoalteromonas sp.]